MDNPTVRQLECFLAVSKQLSFRKAAESCFLSQPALSAQIKQLEATLGAKLFERDRRRVLPTPVGEALAPKAREILADLGEFTETARNFDAPLTGKLRLGVIPTIAPYLLPKTLSGVGRRYPDLRIHLREGQTSELVALLDSGDIDLALVSKEADLGDVAIMDLMIDPFVLAVPMGHRLGKRKRIREEELIQEAVLLLDDGHCLRDQALSVCGTSRGSELGDFRASSLTTLVQMVAGGIGVTLLPQLAVAVEAGADRDLITIPFGAQPPQRTISLIWRRTSLRGDEFAALGEAFRAQLI